MKNVHCVFYRTNLKYDGRVCSIIRTLAQSFPGEKVFLYEFTIQNDYFHGFPSNVSIIKSKLLFNRLKKTVVLQILKNVEYIIRSFLFLLRTRPKTIQVHHENVILGALIYKMLYRKTIVVYDDKEMYFPKNKNLSKILYKIESKLIDLSDLLITTNLYRRKALQFIHKNNIKSIIVDNYVFEPDKRDLCDRMLLEFRELNCSNKKVLLHQGILSENRRIDLLYAVLKYLPEDWVLGFVGIDDSMFNDFAARLGSDVKSKLRYFGFIDYSELNSFYDYVDACVIFYDSRTFNNKYCAPNRLYSAVNNGKPIIVNVDNVTLSNFICHYQNGIAFNRSEEIKAFFSTFEKYRKNAIDIKGKFEFNLTIPELLEYYSQV